MGCDLRTSLTRTSRQEVWIGFFAAPSVRKPSHCATSGSFDRGFLRAPPSGSRACETRDSWILGKPHRCATPTHQTLRRVSQSTDAVDMASAMHLHPQAFPDFQMHGNPPTLSESSSSIDPGRLKSHTDKPDPPPRKMVSDFHHHQSVIRRSLCR